MKINLEKLKKVIESEVLDMERHPSIYESYAAVGNVGDIQVQVRCVREDDDDYILDINPKVECVNSSRVGG